ncbi:MAG: hypothetical protein HFH31_02230 [Bacilli bacterium]|nr:hypothetical protein [Bacilli bacterium]
MSKKTRYDFIKRKHKNYLVLFYENNRYFSIEEDAELLKYLKFWNKLKDLEKKQISYMVFTNVTRVRKYDAKDNQYSRYMKILKVRKIISKLVNNDGLEVMK